MKESGFIANPEKNIETVRGMVRGTGVRLHNFTKYKTKIENVKL